MSLRFLIILLFLFFGAMSAKAEESQQNDLKEDIYIVRAGDTLSSISWRYRTPIPEIISDNSEIVDINKIFIGQRIKISSSKNVALAKNKKAKKSKVENKNESDSSSKNVNIAIVPKNVKNLSPTSTPAENAKRFSEKIKVLYDVEEKTGIPWEILAGLAKAESDFGLRNLGDDGKSYGPFQINAPSFPEITKEQANDWTWSAHWAGEHLVRLGYKDDPIKALRKWNGCLENNKTLKHAKKVLQYSQKYFGFGGSGMPSA